MSLNLAALKAVTRTLNGRRIFIYSCICVKPFFRRSVLALDD